MKLVHRLNELNADVNLLSEFANQGIMMLKEYNSNSVVRKRIASKYLLSHQLGELYKNRKISYGPDENHNEYVDAMSKIITLDEPLVRNDGVLRDVVNARSILSHFYRQLIGESLQGMDEAMQCDAYLSQILIAEPSLSENF